MSTNNDAVVKTTYTAVFAILLVGSIFVTNKVTAGNASADMSEAAIEKRIAQIGKVAIAGGAQAPADSAPAEAAAPAATEAAPAAASAGKSGKEIVDTFCAACHSTGAAGAPKTGDKAAWAGRLGLGLDGLVASVMNGKGAMPPRGGSPASDEELKNAVQYLIDQVR